MKIRYLPCQPHCFSFGGFDLQMINTLNALKNNFNIDIDKLNPWDRNNDFDIIHLWGLDASNFRTAYFAKKNNKKIVLTALTGYISSNISFYKNYFLNKLQLFNYNQKLINLIDVLVVLNEDQAKTAIKYYNIPVSKIRIIPLIVNDIFYNNKFDLNYTYFNKFGIDDFVLCTGNICVRKNQLNLAKACLDINKKLLLIGNISSGEEEYGKELENLVNLNQTKIFWFKEMDNNSIDYITAYHLCSVFALISFDEQQPTSALEASVIGKQLILSNKPYAKQNYFKNSILVNPNFIKDIGNGILEAYKKSNSIFVDKFLFKKFTSTIVSNDYYNLYKELI
jgi:glycosyltransferase involved in cell wall biosynthesis